jgi:ACS family hexuronate transporter-like MFS transporter
VTLVAAAIAISYVDRQTLPVAIGAITRTIHISDAQFGWLQAAFLSTYAVMYVGGGRLLDAIGTRAGFALIMIWWSLACALHGLARGLPLLATARLLLGMGEGGGFPAATRVVAEWLPAEQRSTGMGIINAGTAVGSVLAPPLIGLILWRGNWREVFFVSGTLGLVVGDLVADDFSRSGAGIGGSRGWRGWRGWFCGARDPVERVDWDRDGWWGWRRPSF